MQTILVVEDSRCQREMIATILQNHKFEVVTASHGEEALGKVLWYNPDLVILDIVMPKLNGYEVCRSLRRNESYRDLPIIFCSTQHAKSDRYWGLKQGANAYLGKPFKPQDLFNTVDTLLQKRSPQVRN